MIRLFLFPILAIAFTSCNKASEYRTTMQGDSTRMSLQKGNPLHNIESEATGSLSSNTTAVLDTATFGMGCFWCTEALFQQVLGVMRVQSGYSGGNRRFVDLQTLKQSGHAEVLQIIYDTTQLEYRQLLEMFWSSHDPTTLNRQGNDIGPQYRSVIFYHSKYQEALARLYKKNLSDNEIWTDPVATEIQPFKFFVPADQSQQNFFANNPEKAYCRLVIQPKVEKFKKTFAAKINERVR